MRLYIHTWKAEVFTRRPLPLLSASFFKPVSLTQPRIYQLASLAFTYLLCGQGCIASILLPGLEQILMPTQSICNEDGPGILSSRAQEEDPIDAHQSL